MSEEQKKGRAPDYHAIQPIKGGGEKTYWHRIGAAWCATGEGEAGEEAAAMIRAFLYSDLVRRHKMTVESLRENA